MPKEEFGQSPAEVTESEHKKNYRPGARRLKKTVSLHRLLLLLSITTILSAAFAVYFGVGSQKAFNSKTMQFGLKNIGELATQAGYFTNVQEISGSRQIFGQNIPLTSSKFVFSYDGVIKVGINFAEVKVAVDEQTKTVTVELPEVRVLSTEVDENSFRVFNETNNVFNPLKLDDVNLSLIKLKEEATANAINNGLLENTRTNAELLVKGFLSSSLDAGVYTFVFE